MVFGNPEARDAPTSETLSGGEMLDRDEQI